MNWQPISTAPKDRSVLLWWPEAVEGEWNAEFKFWQPVRLNSHGCGCCGDVDKPPTHWCEIAPPAESDHLGSQ